MSRSFKLFILIFSVCSSAFANGDFYIAFTSDPQLPWACGAGTECARKAQGTKNQAILSNKWQTDSINKLVAQYGTAFKGVIVNGDLTAFGHANQFDMYQKYFEKRIKAPVFPGLGNHDYANNVNDCFQNNCARRMLRYLGHKVHSFKKQVVSFDYKIGKTHYKFPYLRRNHKGSFSYSFNIEGVHFIQLNNQPSYAKKFKGWNFLFSRMEHYEITKPFIWLEKDMQLARAKGQTIIVNMHDFVQHIDRDDKAHLKQLMTKYHAEGVFWGHIHQAVGRSNIGISTPGFKCGSSPFNTYLLAHFEGNHLKEVSVIDSTYGGVSVRSTSLLNG